MKKRLLSLVLMLVMVLSLAGCGSKQPTAKDVLTEMSNAEVSTAEYEMEMSSGGESMKLKLTVSQNDDQNGYAKVEAMIDLPVSAGYSMESYVPLTELYVVDGENIYINVQMLIDFFVELDSQFAMIDAYLALPSDYIVITYDDVIQLCEEMGVELSGLEVTIPTEEEKELNKKNTEALAEVLGDFLNELAANSGEKVIKVADGIVSFTINDDNLEDFIEALSKIDVEKYFKTFAEKIDAIDPTLGMEELLGAELDGLNDALKDEADYVKEHGVDEFGEFSLEFGTKDKENVFSMGMSADDVELKINLKASSEKTEKITAPEDAMDLNDVMGILNELGLMY